MKRTVNAMRAFSLTWIVLFVAPIGAGTVAADTVITHGPMVGRPTATSMRVWVRTSEPTELRVVYGTELPLSRASQGVEGQTAAQRDNTGFVQITGLEPGTRYYYGVVVEGQLIGTDEESEVGFASFRTLPEAAAYGNAERNPRGLFNISFGVGFGNRSFPDEPENPVYRTIQERHGHELMFFVMNGDYMYEHHRTRETAPHGLDLFRADYRHYLDVKPAMARFFRSMPMVFTFDDHEISGETGAGHVGLRRGVGNPPNAHGVYRDIGLRAWYEYVGWAGYDRPQFEPIRYGAASAKQNTTILHDPRADFGSLRPERVSTVHVHIGAKNCGVYELEKVVDDHRLQVRPAFAHDEEGFGYSIGTHHYFDWRVGNCHFFALDCRGERTLYDPRKDADAEQYILGEAQMQWLMEGVRGTDADFVFIVSSVNWMVKHTLPRARREELAKLGRGKEDGFPGALRERRRLLGLFDSLSKPVIILTGDLHCTFAIQITDNVWEFMCGPLTSDSHSVEKAGGPPLTGMYETGGREVRIKWASMDPSEPTEVEPENYYGVVTVNNVARFRDEDGKAAWWAYEVPQVVVQFYEALTGRLAYAEGVSVLEGSGQRSVTAKAGRREDAVRGWRVGIVDGGGTRKFGEPSAGFPEFEELSTSRTPAPSR
jgi:phosphodiesterase/alkaline phosphatase D-like protein